MFLYGLFATAFAFATGSHASSRRAPSHIALTEHVFPLIVAPHHHLLPPSSRYLHRRHRISRVPPTVKVSSGDGSFAHAPFNNSIDIQSDLQTIRGRIYLTNITLAGEEYTLVIDTGSSDTWVASSTFTCINQYWSMSLPAHFCGFSKLFDVKRSKTWKQADTDDFQTAYADGEFISGIMGMEDLGIGGKNEDQLKIRQMIGVAEQGWWNGDDFSSGLLGLAYPTMASNVASLNYTSVIFSLLQDDTIPHIFSLALSRPTLGDQMGGGLLAFGGLPDIVHDDDFVTVPIRPAEGGNLFTFYTIPVDGFEILDPANTSDRSSPSARSAPASAAHPHDQQTQVNGTETRYSTPGLNMAVDSGTSQIILPNPIVKRIASLFSPRALFDPVVGLYRVSCTATAPRVGVVIAGKTFYIHPNDLVNDWQGLQGASDACTLAVQRNDLDYNYVLGDPWLKNVLAVFDVGRNEMSFAARENY